MAGVAFCTLASPAFGQAPTGAASASPTDPGAGTAPVTYASPFAGYRPFAHESPAPWRGVNDEVGRIGGWKAYAREVFEAQKSQAAPGKDAARPASPAPGDRDKAAR